MLTETTIANLKDLWAVKGSLLPAGQALKRRARSGNSGR
jgi:hypothetical protein